MSFLNLKSSKIKNFLFKFLTIIIASFLSLIIVNYVLFRLSNNQNLPRPLASSLSNYLFTYYPDTYVRSNLDNYNAILGDSNAMGSGDGYLNNNYNYSIGHFLFKKNKENYLVYARAGYGSISAVSNYIKLSQLENYLLFNKKMNKPSTILFFFYEGNDLYENLKEFEISGKSFSDVDDYVKFKINQNISIGKGDVIEANFPLLRLLKSTKQHLINLSKESNILSGIYDRIKKIFGKNVILANKELLGVEKKSYWINETKNGNIKDIRPIESAAGDLNIKQKNKSLEIFFESILYLKSWEKKDNIKIVFLPSPATAYDWVDPISYYPRYSKGDLDYKMITKADNEKNSKFIREKIELFSKKNNIQFIDLTNKIKDKAKTSVLHGPIDWIHFNPKGYEFIAKNL